MTSRGPEATVAPRILEAMRVASARLSELGVKWDRAVGEAWRGEE